MNHAASGRDTNELGMVPAKTALNELQIRARLASLAPFHHAIELPFGINSYDPIFRNRDRQSLGRTDSIKRHLWPRLLECFDGTLLGKRVLDVACNCGGFSFLAAESGASEVLGVDCEAHYIAQAKFLNEVLGEDRVEFKQAGLEELDPVSNGQFDVILFFGILYHLENPIEALKRISALARDMIVVDTSMMRLPYINRFIKRPMWTMKIVEPIQCEDVTTGLWRKSRHCQFYPNHEAVIQALKFAGFDDVRYLEPVAEGLEQRYYRGTRGVFIGRKSLVPR